MVDWNRGNAYALVLERADLNGDQQIGAAADHDDFAAIEQSMASALPGAP